MKKLSKLKLKNFTEMNDLEMKNVIGGYGGSGTEDDPYELPEVYVEGTKCPHVTAADACKGKSEGASCCTTTASGGKCKTMPFSGRLCWFG